MHYENGVELCVSFWCMTEEKVLGKWMPDYWTTSKTSRIPNRSLLNPSRTSRRIPSLSSERYKFKESIFTMLKSGRERERGVYSKGEAVTTVMLDYTCLLDRSRGWRVIWECPMAQWSGCFCLRVRTINNAAGQR